MPRQGRTVIVALGALLAVLSVAVQPLAATGSCALLGIFNYSGTARAGSVELGKRLPELVVALMNRQSPASLMSEEETQRKIAGAGLNEFTQAVNLCTDEDYRRIGRKIGVDKVAFLEIQGYSEIRREGQKKTYQVQLGLVVLDCADGSGREVDAEGLSDSASAAMENAAKNLCNSYFDLTPDANIGNKRDENLPVVVNAQSNQYHLPDCHHLPLPANRRDYPTRKAAETDGCLPCRICYPRLASGSTFDRSVEDSLGRTACGQIEYYYRVQDDPAIIARLERVAAPLIADTTRYHVKYRFRYLDDLEVNAFSAPNGYIYVTRGLMEIMESDDELAFVIAHELGHIERKHAVVRYKQALTMAILGSLLASSSDSSSESVMLAVAIEIVLRGFSREQEKEADEVAVSRLKHAGMDWASYRTLFGRFIDLRERRILTIEAVFGTHPKPETRTENLDQMVAVYQRLLGKLS